MGRAALSAFAETLSSESAEIGASGVHRTATMCGGVHPGKIRKLLWWLGILFALPICASWGCTDAGPSQHYMQPIIAVGPNVQVSVANANLEHRETLIAADPNNRAKLIACVVASPATRNGQQTMVYSSADGGLNWLAVLKVGDSNYNSNDPTCAFGAHGRAYFGGFTFAWAPGLLTKFPQGGFVYVSADGGRIWSRPTPVGFGDRPFLAIDHSATSRFFGRVYANSSYAVSDRETHGWDSYFAVFRSLDEGRTFGGPVLVPTRSGRGEVFDGDCATTTSGVLACVFLSPKKSRPPNGVAIVATNRLVGNAWTEVAISHNGGVTFTKPVVVSDAWMLFPGSKISVIPYIAADDGSGDFKDRLYVVWTDVRSGRSEILFSYSADTGKTWSKPLVVNDDNANGAGKVGPDDFQPSIAVNDRGVVGIAWFDRRDILDDLGWRVRFTASLDGGKSVLPSVVVSTAPDSVSTSGPLRLETDEPREFRANREPGQAPTVGGTAFFYDFGGGDTAGLTADAAGVFHTVWIDNRTGVPQMWTATVSIKPAAQFVPVRRLATRYARGLRPLSLVYTHLWKAPLESPRPYRWASGRVEVTDAVDLSLMNGRFDPKSKTVSVDAVLTNISKHLLPSPLELELTSVSSAVGRPSLPSPTVKFQCSSRLKLLAPGQSTAAQHIVVRLSDVRPLAARDFDYVLSLQYLVLQGRVFAQGAP
jgi:hypothetical protein